MRTRWILTLIAGLLLSHSFAQTLTLINGDANGDQMIDDTDLLAVTFAQGLSCSDCPEDLNGDGIVDDADSLIVNFAGGQSGAPAFVGSVQSPSGAFSRSIQLRLGDWVGGVRTVKVQAKPVGTEADASVPIYEWTVQVGGVGRRYSCLGCVQGSTQCVRWRPLARAGCVRRVKL